MSMRTRNKVSNTNLTEKGVKLLILASPVSLHSNDFSVKESFDKNLKLSEFLKNLRFKLDEINLDNFTKVINKAHIVLISTSRFRSRSPNI
jgi:hypothetical protein